MLVFTPTWGCVSKVLNRPEVSALKWSRGTPPSLAPFCGPRASAPGTLQGLALDKKAEPFSEDTAFLGKVKSVPTPVSSSIQSKCKPSIPKSLPENRLLETESSSSNPFTYEHCLHSRKSDPFLRPPNTSNHFTMLVRILLFSNVP